MAFILFLCFCQKILRKDVFALDCQKLSQVNYRDIKVGCDDKQKLLKSSLSYIQTCQVAKVLLISSGAIKKT